MFSTKSKYLRLTNFTKVGIKMEKSLEINELAAAMSALMADVENAGKDKISYGFKYADLAQILSIVRPVLAKHGLAVSQHPQIDEQATSVSVETIVMHKSGQYMSSVLSMPAVAGKGMSAAQAVGSIITYARRYALAAVLSISQEDDDGASSNAESSSVVPKPKVIDLINADQKAELVEKMQSINFDVNRIKNRFSIASIDELQARHFAVAMQNLEKLREQQNGQV